MPHYHRNGGAGTFSLSLMFSAFSLLFLYLAWLLPVVQLAMLFISSVFVMGIMIEERTGAAFISAVAVSLLGFLILPEKTFILPYIIFFGHYGIGKYLIEKKRSSISAMAFKLIYFGAALVLMYFAAPSRLFALLPFELPPAAFFAVMVVIFLVYDFLFSKVAQLYDDRIRRYFTGSHF
jgi:hypothetical protein